MSKLTKALTAAAGNAGGDNLYVEDVFSTYLYTGSGADAQVNNGIDLDDANGMVWIKSRTAATNNIIWDTETSESGSGSGDKYLVSNSTAAQVSVSSPGAWNWPSSGGTGFSLSGGLTSPPVSDVGQDYASWTFRKAEKFFDIQTYTGNGTAGRTIAHNLGSTPAVMIVKELGNTNYWPVYHISVGATKSLYLDLNQGENTWDGNWNNTAPTSAVFTLGSGDETNRNGGTFVAYLFASDAGGFGDDGSESIIKCGSVTTGNVSTDVEVDLGFEPQWILMKNSGATSQWFLVDTMRGWVSPTGVTNQAKPLFPNLSNAESSGTNFVKPTATGFTVVSDNLGAAQNWSYIAIRRPMKTPESGTEVFNTDFRGNGSVDPGYVSGFVTDFAIRHYTLGGSSAYPNVASRLTGGSYLVASSTAAQSAVQSNLNWDYMNGYYDPASANSTTPAWMFKRATGFMDVVAYTGSSSATTQAHNLGVVPELMIVKTRSTTSHWPVYSAALTNTDTLFLNFPDATTSGASGYWNSTTPTDSVFSLGTANATNGSSRTFVAYLFATLAGVSKVGSYTGNATNTAIDCGFSNGARFVLIKRTDSTGDWFVYDSVRGITSGVSPYLLLNTTAAEVTNAGWLESESSGFLVNDNASTQININNANYIFLAIA